MLTRSQYLKHTRQRLGWTQKQLAQEWQTHTGTIAAWERERIEVPWRVIQVLKIYQWALDVIDMGGAGYLYDPLPSTPGDFILEHGIHGLIYHIFRMPEPPEVFKL